MSKLGFGAGLMLGASVIVLAATGASAADLNVESTIASVTVYPSGATVTRTAPVTLAAGATTVILDDLPLELEADSIKVEGAADAGLAIASVETRVVPVDEAADPARVAINDEIVALQDKLAAVDDRIEALDGRRKFLEHLIEAAPSGFGKALAEGAGSIDQWNAAATTIGDGLATVADAVRAARLDQRDVNRQLDERQKALAELRAPSEHQSVRIALSAEAAASGTLTISYHLPSARWVPTYDAQLATGEGSTEAALTLVRRAEVTQATGEDWNGVALTLSTAQALGGTAAPELDPYLVRLFDPDQYSESDNVAAPTAKMREAPTSPAMDSAEAGGLVGSPPPAPAQIIEAAADFGDFRAEYKVPGLASVDSDKGARSLQIATENTKPTLEVRAAPMLSETAYLQASFVASEGSPLLAGKIALFRDGTFVGNGTVTFTNAGDEVDLGFGVDDRVHVTRTTLDHQTGEYGIFSGRKTDTRSYKTTVENLHTRPIAITILDRVPYGESDDIAVKRLDAATAPTETNVDDKRGVLAWTYTYGPGESRDILNAYEVSWPANRSLVALD